MTNPLKGQIEFDLAGKSYKARLTIEAIMGIETALNSSLLKVASQMSNGDVSVTHLINILHPALRGGGNDLSLQDVMKLVDKAGIVSATTAVSQILGKTLNPSEDDQSSKKSEQE